MKSIRILVINPGSTTTKIAIYDNTICSLLKTLHHSMAELAPFKTVGEQFEFRKGAILKELEHDRIDLESIDTVIGR